MRDISGPEDEKTSPPCGGVSGPEEPTRKFVSAKSGTRAARHQRTYRVRLRKQLAVLRVTIHSDFIVALLDAGWLTPEQALDRANLEQCAGDVIASWSRMWREWLG
jgi:hypothetical protein